MTRSKILKIVQAGTEQVELLGSFSRKDFEAHPRLVQIRFCGKFPSARADGSLFGPRGLLKPGTYRLCFMSHYSKRVIKSQTYPEFFAPSLGDCQFSVKVYLRHCAAVRKDCATINNARPARRCLYRSRARSQLWRGRSGPSPARTSRCCSRWSSWAETPSPSTIAY